MRKFTLFALFFALSLAVAEAYPAEKDANIKLRIAVINPAPEGKDVLVNYSLPKAVEPEDIIDHGKMSLVYNFDKGVYDVRQTIEMEAAERRVLEIKIRDIWVIPARDTRSIKDYAGGLISKLEGTKRFRIGSRLSKSISKELDKMKADEIRASLNAQQKIATYYKNMRRMRSIKKNITALTGLAVDTGFSPEEAGLRFPDVLARLDAVDKGIGLWETVKIEAKITNPSTRKKSVSDLRHPLPEGLTPNLILDPAGLEVRYDFEKKRFYLFKSGIELKPGEERVFVVRAKDIWKASGGVVIPAKAGIHPPVIPAKAGIHIIILLAIALVAAIIAAAFVINKIWKKKQS